MLLCLLNMGFPGFIFGDGDTIWEERYHLFPMGFWISFLSCHNDVCNFSCHFPVPFALYACTAFSPSHFKVLLHLCSGVLGLHSWQSLLLCLLIFYSLIMVEKNPKVYITFME